MPCQDSRATPSASTGPGTGPDPTIPHHPITTTCNLKAASRQRTAGSATSSRKSDRPPFRCTSQLPSCPTTPTAPPHSRPQKSHKPSRHPTFATPGSSPHDSPKGADSHTSPTSNHPAVTSHHLHHPTPPSTPSRHTTSQHPAPHPSFSPLTPAAKTAHQHLPCTPSPHDPSPGPRPAFASTSSRVPLGACVVHISGSRAAQPLTAHAAHAAPWVSSGFVISTARRFERAATPPSTAQRLEQLGVAHTTARPSRGNSSGSGSAPGNAAPSPAALPTVAAVHGLLEDSASGSTFPSPAAPPTAGAVHRALEDSASGDPSGMSRVSRVVAKAAELERCLAQARSAAQRGLREEAQRARGPAVVPPPPSDAARAPRQPSEPGVTEYCSGTTRQELGTEAAAARSLFQSIEAQAGFHLSAHVSSPDVEAQARLHLPADVEAGDLDCCWPLGWGAASALQCGSHTSCCSLSRVASSLQSSGSTASDGSACGGSSGGSAAGCDSPGSAAAQLHNRSPRHSIGSAHAGSSGGGGSDSCGALDSCADLAAAAQAPATPPAAPTAAAEPVQADRYQLDSCADLAAAVQAPATPPAAGEPGLGQADRYQLELLNPAFHSDEEGDDDWDLFDSFCTCKGCRPGQGQGQQCRMCPMPMPLNPLFYQRISGECEVMPLAVTGAARSVEEEDVKSSQQQQQQQEEEVREAAAPSPLQQGGELDQQQQGEDGDVVIACLLDDIIDCVLTSQEQELQQEQEPQLQEQDPPPPPQQQQQEAGAGLGHFVPAWWTRPGASMVATRWALRALLPAEHLAPAGGGIHELQPTQHWGRSWQQGSTWGFLPVAACWETQPTLAQHGRACSSQQQLEPDTTTGDVAPAQAGRPCAAAATAAAELGGSAAWTRLQLHWLHSRVAWAFSGGGVPGDLEPSCLDLQPTWM